jgi:uncharacterized membrane-anchored protein
MARADGKNLDLRVSDAERDAVASELSQHFQDGRLDQAEYDKRVTAAMAAKTQRDLDELLADLPRASAGQPGWAASEPDQAGPPGAAPWRSAPSGLTSGRPRVLALLPLLVAAVVIGGLLTGGWQRGWPFAPFGLLWLIVPILVVRTWARGGRRRQWR